MFCQLLIECLKGRILRCLTDLGSVVGGTEDEFWCSVVPRANVRDVWLVLYQYLGAAKVTKLQYATVGIEKKVLRLDVAMADALRMDVGERSEELVDVELDLEYRHGRLHLVEKSRRSVDGLRHELLDEVQVHFILLWAS